jgi:hypothetical protein
MMGVIMKMFGVTEHLFTQLVVLMVFVPTQLMVLVFLL